MAARTNAGDVALPERIRRARELREAVRTLPLAPHLGGTGRLRAKIEAYRRAKGSFLSLRVEHRRRGLPRWQAATEEEQARGRYERAKLELRTIISGGAMWLIDVDDTVERAEAALDPNEREEIDEWVDGQRSAVHIAQIREQGREEQRARANEQRASAGHAGAGQPKRPHTALVYRIARDLGAERVLAVLEDDDQRDGWQRYATDAPELPIYEVRVDREAQIVVFESRDAEQMVTFRAVKAAANAAIRKQAKPQHE